MRIPIAENQVAEKPQGTFDVPNLPNPPEGAFGGGVNRATAKLGNTVENIGTALAEHVAKRMQQDQMAQVLQADTDFRQKLQNTIFSTEPDEQTGKPKGVFNRLRADASGATTDYDAQARGIMDDSLNSLQNPVQKRELTQRMNETYETYRRAVIRHEATQVDENRKDIYESNMSQRISDAGIITDPASLNKYIDSAHNDAYRQLRDYGFDEKTVIPEKLGDLSMRIVESAVKGSLEDNPYESQRILDGVTDSNLPGAKRAQLQHVINAAKKQFETRQKQVKDLTYDENMKKAMLDMFDGNLTLSEAQRMFRDDVLKKSDYDLLESKLVKPDYTGLNDPLKRSDPSTYNEIRDAQLSGEKSPGEITRMIAQGGADGKISPADGPFLDKLTKQLPPDPRDKDIDSQAGGVRDFGNRYFKETFLGVPVKKEKTSNEIDALVNDFYSRVDKENASGERIGEISNEVMGSFIKKRYPEINRLEDIPHIIVGVDGQVQRFLNPGQKTKLKAKYKITPTGQSE